MCSESRSFRGGAAYNVVNAVMFSVDLCGLIWYNLHEMRVSVLAKHTQKYRIDYSVAIPMSNKNLQRIIKFYLFECPVKGKSVRGKKFEDYGITKSPAFSALKKSMMENATLSLRKNYKPFVKGDLQVSFDEMEKTSPTDEYCVFLKYDEKNVMQSLFSAIRNAFAHGSFCIKRYSGTPIYFLVNYDGYLKAQIVLHESTLLSWIDCIKNFE